MLFGLTFKKLFVPNFNTGKLKTETRRRIKFGEQTIDKGVIYENGHQKYWVGKEEPIRATWDGESVGIARITNLYWDDVRTISKDAVHREGFTLTYQFLERWVMMHDKAIFPKAMKLDGRRKIDYEARKKMLLKTKNRKGEDALNYMAWDITFEVIPESLNLNHFELKNIHFDMEAFLKVLKEQPKIPSIIINGGADFLEYFHPRVSQSEGNDPNEFKQRVTLYDAIQYSAGIDNSIDRAIDENKMYTQQSDDLF